jgi:hypothetical protein
MSSAETQKWLRQNVHSYPQKDLVYADVDSALARFPTLRPKLDVYSSVMQLLSPCFSLLTRILDIDFSL